MDSGSQLHGLEKYSHATETREPEFSEHMEGTHSVHTCVRAPPTPHPHLQLPLNGITAKDKCEMLYHFDSVIFPQ